MKFIIGIIFSLLSIQAIAIDFEMSLGQAKYSGSSKDGGDWRQNGPASQGYRDEFNLVTNTWGLGIIGDIAPSWKFRAGYTNLGTTTSGATATAADAWFDFKINQCVKYCDTLASWFGKSNVDGIYLTVVKSFDVVGFKPFIETGAWYYKNEFTMWAYTPKYMDGDSGGVYQTPIKNGWRIGPVIGFGIRKNNTSIAMTWYDVSHNEDIYPAINDSAPTMVLSLRHSF